MNDAEWGTAVSSSFIVQETVTVSTVSLPPGM